MSTLGKHLISGRATVRELLARLNAVAGTLVLVTDDNGRLERTISDGDIRRAMLSDIALDGPISSLPIKEPWFVRLDEPLENALELMMEHGIDLVPQVDKQDRPVRLLARRDFEEKVWLSSPHLGSLERSFVDEAFRSNWIAPLGPDVDQFEQEIAAVTGVLAAAAVSSGTAALHLALILEGTGPGDVVFCSDLTFVASVNPVLYQGARPVLIDSEADSCNMSPAALEIALDRAHHTGEMPKAIVLANIYGQQANMDEIIPLAEKYGVPIIEDAAESLGATYRDRPSGSFGKSAILSFNGNKIITTSGGGMLVSDDNDLITRARFLATQAKDDAPYYLHSQVGYNYRMSNILAAIGRGQLRVLDERVEVRRGIYRRYREALSDIPGIHWFDEPKHSKSTCWLSVVLLSPDGVGVSPADLIEHLAEIGVEARRLWRPMHMQPLLKSAKFVTEVGDVKKSFSRRHFERGICLPSGSNMSEGQQERIIARIRSLFEAKAA